MTALAVLRHLKWFQVCINIDRHQTVQNRAKPTLLSLCLLCSPSLSLSFYSLSAVVKGNRTLQPIKYQLISLVQTWAIIKHTNW